MSQVTDIPRWKMLSDPVDEPVAVPRWKQLSDPVDTAPPQTDFGPDQVTIDSPGWQDSPPVSDSPLTPDMQAIAAADPVYQELQRRKAVQTPAVDPYSSQGRINTLAAAEGLPTDGQPTPAGAYTPLSPDIQPRGLLGNIGASAGQTAIHAIPRVIRDELPMSLQHPRPVEEGAGKVIGEAIGGLIPSTERPGDLLAMTKLFGAAEKAAAPLVKRIEAAAGPRVAAIAEKSLAGAGSAAPFGAIHEAGSNFEEWETDPARKLGKVMLAAGSSAAAGGVGGAGMGAVGGRSTHTDAITEARTAEINRQYREDTGRAFDPSTGTPEPTPEPATNANRPTPIGDRVAQESVPVTVPDNRLADAQEAGPRVAEAGLVKDGNTAESQIVAQPTPPIDPSVAATPKLSIAEDWGDAVGRGEYKQRLVAKDESGEAVGQVTVSYLKDEPGTAYVHWVEVPENMRRRGIATAMYDWIKQTQNVTEIKRMGDVSTPEGALFRKSLEPKQTIPESPATLEAQMQAMRDGKRPAVLVTEGAAMPDKGEFAKLKTEAGVFIYDPKQVKPTEIKAAVAEDRVGDILGMGIPRKPEPGTEAGVVVVRTPEGVEKQAVVTDEARKMAGPGDTVGLETAEGVVRGRVEGAATPVQRGMPEGEVGAEQSGRITANVDDLDARQASQAFNNTSHDPERRGDMYRRDYVETFGRVRDGLEPLAKTPEQRAALAVELERFRRGLIERYRAFFSAHSNVASPMVTGPANFPVERNAKRMRSADARRAEIGELVKKAEASIRRKLFPSEAASISSDRADAPELLRKEIADAEKLHEAMRATNKIILDKSIPREQKAGKIAALGFTEERANELLNPKFGQSQGFPSYHLQNNRANIKRMKDRIASIETTRSREARETTFDGGRIVENKEANRVQVLFDGKPDGATRDKLKSRGFRWSPSEGAWQRQLNEGAWRVANDLMGAKEATATPKVADATPKVASKEAPPKTGTDAVDAKIAAQYDPKQTPEMFGEPEVRRARTDEPPGEEGGPETTGIAHRVSEAQGMEVERGVGIGPEASVERGRALLKSGTDPERVIADFNKDGLVNHDRIAVVRAWEADLAKKSAAADEKYGHGSKQSDAAFKAWTDAKAAIKPMQTEWHRIGQAQQGETEIDTGTFHGMRAAHHEAGGKDFTPKQAESAKKLSSEVKAKTEAVEAAKEVVRDVTPEVELEPSAKSLADRIVAKLDKASTESLEWLKKNYLTGTTLRSGIDPTALYHLSRYGAAKIAKGVVKFSAWSAEMVKDLGESIQPHLKAVWEAADKELDRLVMADQSHAAAVQQAKVKPPKVATPESIAARANSKSSATAISNVAKDLSRAFIRKGIKDREANVDAVHDALSKVLPTLTREQTSDAMSGYGDYRPLNKDPVEVRRREIAGEVQQVRKLQDMAGGKAPKRSGVERQAPTDEARDLTRRVNEAKKVGGYVTTDPATQLRTALDARKTYVRNRITDLQKQIDDGVKAKKSNKPAPTDSALDALRARLKKVQEHYDKKFPEDKTPEQIKAINAQIAELDAHLKAGTVPAKKATPAPAAGVADLRAQRDALRARVMHADPARREAIRQQIKVLEGHLKAGTKPIPDPVKPAPADIQKLRDKRDALAKQLRKPPPVDVSAHPPGTAMTPERVKALWKLAIPHVESGVTNFGTLADILAKQTKLPTSDIRSGLSAKGAAKKKLAELDDAAWALYKAKKNARDWLRAQAPKTPLQKVLHYSGALRALETTGEFSVLGIQAASRLPISIGHAITHPFNPKMLRQDVRTFYRGLQAFSPRKAHEIDMEMQRSPRYQEAQRAGVRLYDEEHTPTGLEEIKTRSFLDRVWGVKHSLRGFDRFSRIVLNDIKLNHYQMLAETMPGGKPTKQQAKVIADIANLIGGTTNLGKAEAIAGSANALLFSARLAAARARFLASPVEFSIRGTNETRIAYAKTMAQWMIGNTAIYGAFALAGYEIGDDPRSNKFGKVKIGETWIDMTGGLSSYVTLGARQATGQTITDKGDLKDLGGPGPYDQSRLSIAATFARGKLSPWASLFVDYMDNQHNVIGQPMDSEYFARKITPLTWWDVAQAVREESPNDAAAISVLALFGKGVRNRPDDKKDK